ELEAVEHLVGNPARVAADHVAHVQLRDFVVGHVVHAVAALPQLAHDLLPFRAPLCQRERDEDLRARRTLIAIVEFRDAAPAERLREFEEAPRLLGNLHREQRLTAAAEVRALRDVPQAVEVDVRPAVHRDEPTIPPSVARYEFANARHGERPGRLDDGASVLEHVLNRPADLVRADENDLVDALARDRERLLADAPDGDAVREYADALQDHASPGLQRLVHRRGVLGLDTDDAHPRVEILDEDRDAGNEPSATDRNEYGIELPAALARDLHADRALPGDHVGVVEGMHEREISLTAQLRCALVRRIVVVAVQNRLAAEIDDRLNFDLRGRLRHDDHRGHAASASGERDALRVIAGRRAYHAAARDCLREMRDLVVGAAQLEREDRLQVLALEQNARAEPLREPWRRIERRFDRYVVNARLENAFDIGTGHSRSISNRQSSERSVGPSLHRLRELVQLDWRAFGVAALEQRQRHV